MWGFSLSSFKWKPPKWADDILTKTENDSNWTDEKKAIRGLQHIEHSSIPKWKKSEAQQHTNMSNSGMSDLYIYSMQ